jgi:hypothetical protein
LNQERHGIDIRNWRHYQRVAEIAGKNAGLALVELFRDATPLAWSGSLLVETLVNLGTPIMGFSNQDHMLYWKRKQFVDLDSWSPTDLLAIARGQLAAAYPVELHGIFAYQPATQKTLL